MRTSRGSRGVLAVLFSLLLTGVVLATSAPAGAGTKWKVAASGKTTAKIPLANANTEIQNPVKIEVTVTKGALVQWTVDCTKGGKEIMLPSGKATLKGAGSVQVKITKSASDCAIAANADDFGTGIIKLSIEFSGGSVGEG
jgi:hypothetical protein